MPLRLIDALTFCGFEIVVGGDTDLGQFSAIVQILDFRVESQVANQVDLVAHGFHLSLFVFC